MRVGLTDDSLGCISMKMMMGILGLTICAIHSGGVVMCRTLKKSNELWMHKLGKNSGSRPIERPYNSNLESKFHITVP